MPNGTKKLNQMTEEEQRAFLGEDYEVFVELKVKRDRGAKVAKAKELATSAIGENGKYYEDYHKLENQLDRVNAQMDAIWDKAMSEAEEEAGLVEEESPKKTR